MVGQSTNSKNLGRNLENISVLLARNGGRGQIELLCEMP